MTVIAELTSGGIGLANQQVLIQIGGAAAFGITGSDGRATVPIALNTAPPATMPAATTLSRVVRRDRGARKDPGDARSFVLGRAPTSLSAITPFVTTTDDLAGVLTTLTATRATTDQPLMSRTVTVTVDGPITRTLSLITDYLGRVRLPLDLPAGTYAAEASFAGDETYEPGDRRRRPRGRALRVPRARRQPADHQRRQGREHRPCQVFLLGGDHGLGVRPGHRER